MHLEVKDHLEEYLRDPESRTVPQDVKAHVQGCSACAGELQLMRENNRLLQAFRSDIRAVPAPGFYARVMNLIEEQTTDSLWSVFLEPTFGKRLVITCGALVALLGSYLVSVEKADHAGATAPPAIVASQDRSGSLADDGVQAQRRDAVLVNLVSYQE